MIYINCPLKQDYIIELIEGIKEYTFTLQEKKGIQLVFSTDCINDDLAVSLIKKTIKETEVGKVLYFTVESR